MSFKSDMDYPHGIVDRLRNEWDSRASQKELRTSNKHDNTDEQLPQTIPSISFFGAREKVTEQQGHEQTRASEHHYTINGDSQMLHVESPYVAEVKNQDLRQECPPGLVGKRLHEWKLRASQNESRTSHKLNITAEQPPQANPSILSFGERQKVTDHEQKKTSQHHSTIDGNSQELPVVPLHVAGLKNLELKQDYSLDKMVIPDITELQEKIDTLQKTLDELPKTFAFTNIFLHTGKNQQDKEDLQKKLDKSEQEKDELRKEIDKLQKELDMRKAQFKSAWKNIPLYADWRKEEFKAVNVTLDATTAHPDLLLSEESTRVSWQKHQQKLPSSSQRFTSLPCVLGHLNINSGRVYWQVKVENKGSWDLGICMDSVTRKDTVTMSPQNGFWAIRLYEEQYWALTDPVTQLTLIKNPLNIGIFLDYEAGEISFYNMADASHIFTFPHNKFYGILRPLFRLRSSDSGSLTVVKVEN